MRKVIIYCDRCGKEFEKWNDKRKELIGVAEFVYDDKEPYLDCQKDLCESCYDELEKWWNSKSAAEDVDTKLSFKVGDKVRTLVETVQGDDLFPVGTIGVISYIDKYDANLPYVVYSKEYNFGWYYPGDALELVDKGE